MAQSGLLELFLRYFHIVVLKKRAIISVTLLSTVIAIVCVLLSQSTYRSDALIKPPTNNGSSSLDAALQSAGGGLLSSFLGGTESGANDCMSILKSVRFAKLVIDKFDLETAYKFKVQGKTRKYFFADVVKRFQQNAQFQLNDDNDAIEISMMDTSADQAKEMVAFMIHTLDSLYTDMQRTSSQHRLEYVDQRLTLVEGEMKEQEDTLVAFQTRHNLIVPEAQVRLILENATQTEIQVETLNEDLALEGALRGTSSPRYRDLEVQKGLLQKTLRSRLRSPSDSNTLILPTNTLPALATEYFRLERSYQIKLAVYKYLVQQVEALKLEANKNIQVISVLDPPWANDKRISPKRGVIVETVFILAFLLSVFVVVLSSVWKKHVAENPENRKLLLDIKTKLFRF